MGDATAKLLAAILERDVVGVLMSLKEGAKANFSGRNKGRPLHFVAYDKDSEDVLTIMNHLLTFGAEIDAQDDRGFTPLMVASLNSHENIARMLLHHKANPEITRGNTGERALHLAMNRNCLGIATALLDAGADMNAKTSNDNSTALHLAALVGNSLSAEALIKHSTFEREILHTRNNRGETPGEVATRKGHHELARRFDLIETPLTDAEKKMVSAILSSNVEDLESALDKGADVNKATSKYATPLHYATVKGSLPLVQALLARGANVEAKDNDGYTPLMVASLRGHTDVVERLLSHRVDPNSKSYKDETALHLAVIHDNRPIVRSLVANGASVNAETKNRSTPLHLAARYNAIDSGEELVITPFCKRDLKNANGDTASDIARRRRHAQFCSILNVREETDEYELMFQDAIEPRVIITEEMSLGPDIYKNNTLPRGKVLIINNLFKKDRKKFRKGAYEDTLYLRNLFEKMGYKVQDEEEGLTKERILEVLKAFRNDDMLGKVDSAFFFLMSHGSDGKFLTEDYKLLEESEVQEIFKDVNCAHLKGKPKVFVYNFCRGTYTETRMQAHTGTDSKVIGYTEEEKEAPSKESIENCKEAPKDMLSIHAATDGIKALRHETLGTFLIKTLCQVLAKFAHNRHILDMIIKISDQMELEAATTPEVCQWSFKNFYLNPTSKRITECSLRPDDGKLF